MTRERRTSIKDLARFLSPGAKRLERFFSHHRNHGNLALRMRLSKLFVDRGIVKPDFRGVRAEIGKVDSVHSSPVDRPHTHGTWFAGGIKIAAPKFEAPKFLASLSNRQHFSVRRRIVHRRHSICPDRK